MQPNVAPTRAQIILSELNAYRRLTIRHYFTRPYRPQTNGKVERFIRTLLHEWAYAQAYGRSVYRTRALARYLRFYNAERRHTALGYTTPLQRLATKQ